MQRNPSGVFYLHGQSRQQQRAQKRFHPRIVTMPSRLNRPDGHIHLAGLQSIDDDALHKPCQIVRRRRIGLDVRFINILQLKRGQIVFSHEVRSTGQHVRQRVWPQFSRRQPPPAVCYAITVQVESGYTGPVHDLRRNIQAFYLLCESKYVLVFVKIRICLNYVKDGIGISSPINVFRNARGLG